MQQVGDGQRPPAHVLVVGGGITGLSAAYYVNQWSKERDLPVRLTVMEGSERWGGKIRTLRRDGFVIERGPDSFLARKQPIIDLTLALGLGDQLTATNARANRTYIVRQGQLHPMPRGLNLGIPTEWRPFLTTGLLSPGGKLRAALDWVLPRSQAAGDESLGDFLERRLGKEVLERIVEPLLAGIYAGDTHRLSLMATFPQFRAAEQRYGSLIRGTMASKAAAASAAPAPRQAAASVLPEHVRGSLFLTYLGGLTTLVDTLTQSLQDDARLLTHCPVNGIERWSDDGEAGSRFQVAYGEGHTEIFDAIIITLPTGKAARLLPSVPGLDAIGRMPYVSVANVIMAFRSDQVGPGLDGSGFLVPRMEGRLITACTWTSRKWLHTAPDGYELIRCYIGGSGAENWQELSDEQLMRGALADMRDLIGLQAEPLFYEVTRLPDSMPQYPVGHLERIREARDELALRMPGIAVTGAGFHGVGLPDCIRQGREAAEDILNKLTNDRKR